MSAVVFWALCAVRLLMQCLTLLFAKAALLRLNITVNAGSMARQLFINIDMPQSLLLPYHPPGHVEEYRREKTHAFYARKRRRR